MMEMVEIILSPITGLMHLLLEFYTSIFPSLGAAILLLSFTFALLLQPFRSLAQQTENRIRKKMKAANEEVCALKGILSGEKLFLETEKIYKKYDYHPIQSVGIGASFLVMLPVLISAILLFSGDGILVGKVFLYIGDLSLPDSLLGPVNFLPLLMFAITLIDARLQFRDDRQSQCYFLFISLVLVVLVYSLSAGLVLYWTGSNLMSLIFTSISRMRGR